MDIQTQKPRTINPSFGVKLEFDFVKQGRGAPPPKVDTINPEDYGLPSPAQSLPPYKIPRLLRNYDDLASQHEENTFDSKCPASSRTLVISEEASLCKDMVLDSLYRRDVDLDTTGKSYADARWLCKERQRLISGREEYRGGIQGLTTVAHLEIVIKDLESLAGQTKYEHLGMANRKPSKQWEHVFVFHMPHHYCGYCDQVNLGLIIRANATHLLKLYTRPAPGSQLNTITNSTHIVVGIPLQRAEYISFIVNETTGFKDWRTGLFMGITQPALKKDWLRID